MVQPLLGRREAVFVAQRGERRGVERPHPLFCREPEVEQRGSQQDGHGSPRYGPGECRHEQLLMHDSFNLVARAAKVLFRGTMGVTNSHSVTHWPRTHDSTKVLKDLFRVFVCSWPIPEA